MNRRSFIAGLCALPLVGRVAKLFGYECSRRLRVKYGESVFLVDSYDEVIVERGGSITGCNSRVVLGTLTLCEGASFVGDAFTAGTISIGAKQQ